MLFLNDELSLGKKSLWKLLLKVEQDSNERQFNYEFNEIFICLERQKVVLT